MKVSTFAQLARESEMLAVVEQEIPVIDMGAELESTAEDQMAEVQAEIIEGDYEAVDAVADSIEGPYSEANAVVAAETIRVLAKRYGVAVKTISKESLSGESSVAALRRDAVALKTQIALAKEAVGNRTLNKIGNWFKERVGSFDVDDKRFAAIIAAAKKSGNSTGSTKKTFDNGIVIENITSDGKLLEGKELNTFANAVSTALTNYEGSFKQIANFLNSKAENAAMDFNNVFPGAKNGTYMPTGDMFIGKRRLKVTGINGKAVGLNAVISQMASLGAAVETAKDTVVGSDGLAVLDAADVLVRVQDLQKINEDITNKIDDILDNWMKTDIERVGFTSPIRTLAGLAGLGTVVATFTSGATGAAIGTAITILLNSAVSYHEHSRNSTDGAKMGGFSAAQANSAIYNFNGVLFTIFKFIHTAWKAVSTNLLHYYGWCLKNQVKQEAQAE